MSGDDPQTGGGPGKEGRPEQGGFSAADQAAVSILWFAFFTQWIAIPTIILPSQVARILGQDAPGLALATGIIAAAGAAVALVVAPVAGALSDDLRTARGRRRPFLIVGTLASCAGLLLLASAAGGGSILLYGLAFLHLQFWWNWVSGAYAGLIPDVVPPRFQAAASGWMNAMTILGVVVGNGAVALLYAPDNPLPTVAVFVGISLASLLAMIARVREPASPGTDRSPGLAAWLGGFYLDPRTHRTFYLVLLTRLFSNMGVWSVLTFLLFYLQSVLGMRPDEAVRLLAAMLGGGAVLSIPASLLGMRYADRFGVVRIVRVTSWVMALATVGYVAIALAPSVWLVVAAVLVFSVANGAYGAADWYLALRVLPRPDRAGKDLGIWHVCMVLPQIVGPVTTGWLITVVEREVSARFAYELAFGIAAAWFLLAAALVGRVRLPDAMPLPPPGAGGLSAAARAFRSARTRRGP